MEHRMEQNDNRAEVDMDRNDFNIDMNITDDFPEVDIYSVSGEQTDFIRGYLTDEAFLLTRNGEAVCLAIAEVEQVVGAICARLDPANERCLDIISLYVVPEYRGRHLGGTLVAEITDAFLDGTDGMIDRVEMLFSDSPELEAFLKEIGFQVTEVNDVEDEIEPFSRLLPVSALADSTLLQHSQTTPRNENLLKFQELSDARVLQLSSILDEADANYLDMDGMKQVLPDISFVMTDEKMNPVACAVYREWRQSLSFPALYLQRQPACRNGGDAGGGESTFGELSGRGAGDSPAGSFLAESFRASLGRCRKKYAFDPGGMGNIKQTKHYALTGTLFAGCRKEGTNHFFHEYKRSAKRVRRGRTTAI